MVQPAAAPESDIPDSTTIFRPGHNCWRVERARHAAMVVDCANYYRDLAESLLKAKHSIFITGWDIDSRIELVRGEEKTLTLYDILTQKAKENPDLQIYLNRWNYAFFMAGSREPLAFMKWKGTMLPNIHYHHDNLTPMGACHHQKVIVVDDVVAYTGGMDIAFGRWDHRSHHPDNEKRVDPGGVYRPSAKVWFPPYHDIMTVMSGPVAQALGELSRERWRRVSGYEAIPLRKAEVAEIPHCWPDSDPPDFEDIEVAITRTIPPYANIKEAFEIEKMYLDEIARAEKFIYIENQYLARMNIAHAMKARLLENPDLRILMVSSYDPQGFFEKATMWVGRLKFKQVFTRAGLADRVCMAYPISRGMRGKRTVRIHSKLMITDDKFLHIGSANLNNRSMRFDTECDVVYAGKTEAQCAKIADVRNDLIREHTGMEADDIQGIIDRHESPEKFLEIVKGSRQSLMKIRDMRFFKGKPQSLLVVGDPEKELIPSMPIPEKESTRIRFFPKKTIVSVIALFLFAASFVMARKYGLIDEIGTREGLIATLESIRGTQGAVSMAIAIYIAAAMIFVPVTLLTGAVAVMFGYWYGLLISIVGVLVAAILGYGAGRFIGHNKFKLFAGTTMERLKTHARGSNVIAITFLRMIPVAPFTAVNMALGIFQVPFMVYLAGNILGLVPGKFITVFLAYAIGDFWLNPGPGKIAMAAVGVGLWLALIWGTHLLYRKWRKKSGQAS